jgi:integrase
MADELSTDDAKELLALCTTGRLHAVEARVPAGTGLRADPLDDYVLIRYPRITSSRSRAVLSRPAPKPSKRVIAPLDVAQARQFLEVAGEHRLGGLFSVALACGLRLGEATGLRWEDVNLETGELHVRQQLQRVGKQLVPAALKTVKSRRTLALPQVCVDALRAHRARQREERLKAGPRWVETGLVFTTHRHCKPGKGLRMKVGAGLHPRNVLRLLHDLLKAAALPRCRFHDLRHSAASLLIAAGVELVEVSMLLGHSELRVTADLYSHLQQQTAARAARTMDAVLGAAKNG